jgi:signal transduction histidine kinase
MTSTTSDMIATREITAPATAPSRPGWFEGLNWTGLGLIVLLCLVNAVRRMVQMWEAPHPLSWLEWLASVARVTGHSTVVAAMVILVVVPVYNRTRGPAWLRYALLILALLVSLAVGVFLARALENNGWWVDPSDDGSNDPLLAYISAYVSYGSLCVLSVIVYVYLRAADASAARAQEAEQARARFVERMEQARLKMLQAQIEPHFLFNTLANVRRLYQTSPTDAAAMFDNLMRYFEVALPHMRADHSTLGREADLTLAFLSIQRIRMGRRLEFTVNVPSALREAELPPMMLLTLVENAIKHGLAPLPEGGRVDVSAHAAGDEIEVRVVDTGRGFAESSSGGGTGLANIRARLAALYGSRGRVTLAVNTPRGIAASITAPLVHAPAVEVES